MEEETLTSIVQLWTGEEHKRKKVKRRNSTIEPKKKTSLPDGSSKTSQEEPRRISWPVEVGWISDGRAVQVESGRRGSRARHMPESRRPSSPQEAEEARPEPRMEIIYEVDL